MRLDVWRRIPIAVGNDPFVLQVRAYETVVNNHRNLQGDERQRVDMRTKHPDARRRRASDADDRVDDVVADGCRTVCQNDEQRREYKGAKHAFSSCEQGAR